MDRRANLTTYAILLVVAGCAARRDEINNAGHSMGAILMSDVRSAKYYEKQLPEYLGMSARRMDVLPDSGFTHVTLSGVASASERQRISSLIDEANRGRDPRLDPIRCDFK